MTFAELKAETLRRAGENPALPRFYTAAEAGAAINAAQRVFSFLTLCLEQTAIYNYAAGTLMGDISQFVPTWIAPLRVEAAGVKLTSSKLADFRGLNPRWMDASQLGVPSRYAMLGFDEMVLFPRPAASVVLSLRFAAIPTTMTLDGDVPEIPVEDHSSLADYALARMTAKEGAEPLAGAMGRIRNFLAVAANRQAIVKAQAQELSYDTQPSERWLTLLENPKWPSILQR